MVLSKTIKVTVNSKTFKKYKELGYSFDKVGDEIKVNYQHLAKIFRRNIRIKM